MTRSASILVNRDKPDVDAAAQRVRDLVEKHGRLVCLCDADDAPLPESARDADLFIVLGGDGTLLGQTRRTIDLDTPLLGVNFGKVGFMAEFEFASFEEQAPALLANGPLVTQKLPMLAAEVYRQGESTPCFAGSALNDVVLTAGPPFRMIGLDLSIDANPGPSIDGDGLIVSTPIGSTAYSVSAGGSIVAPAADVMAVTPIAAHSLAFRPVVLPLSSVVEVTMRHINRDDCGSGTTLVLDGQRSTLLSQGDRVVVREHERSARFVRNTRSNYWDTLITKMRWAAPPASRTSRDGLA